MPPRAASRFPPAALLPLFCFFRFNYRTTTSAPAPVFVVGWKYFVVLGVVTIVGLNGMK
jgi:hypothetical protein